MTKLPKLTKQPVLHVDARLDAEYPIRILRAYLANAGCDWEVIGLSEAERRVYDTLNEHNRQRRRLLGRAMAILERALAELKEVAK